MLYIRTRHALIRSSHTPPTAGLFPHESSVINEACDTPTDSEGQLERSLDDRADRLTNQEVRLAFSLSQEEPDHEGTRTSELEELTFVEVGAP
jgi:hypothetical protein